MSIPTAKNLLAKFDYQCPEAPKVRGITIKQYGIISLAIDALYKNIVKDDEPHEWHRVGNIGTFTREMKTYVKSLGYSIREYTDYKAWCNHTFTGTEMRIPRDGDKPDSDSEEPAPESESESESEKEASEPPAKILKRSQK